MTYKLFTDGGSRGNPGPAAIAAIIFDEKWLLIDFMNQYSGEATNNHAEYLALIEGISLALKNKIKELDCYLDSELVVKQLNNEYKVKDENLKLLKKEIDGMIEKFDRIRFVHVRREKNKFADKLVNLALDNKLKQ